MYASIASSCGTIKFIYLYYIYTKPIMLLLYCKFYSFVDQCSQKRLIIAVVVGGDTGGGENSVIFMQS